MLTEPVADQYRHGVAWPRVFGGRGRQLTCQHGALLVIDETHTISITGYAGYSGQIGLEPDMPVLGKPIAGWLPAAVYGMSAEVAACAEALLASKPDGYSGTGTTLSANLFTLAAMRANLDQVMTRDAIRPHHAAPAPSRLADAPARCLPTIAALVRHPKSARAANFSFAPPRRAPAPRRKQPWTTRWSA